MALLLAHFASVQYDGHVKLVKRLVDFLFFLAPMSRDSQCMCRTMAVPHGHCQHVPQHAKPQLPVMAGALGHFLAGGLVSSWAARLVPRLLAFAGNTHTRVNWGSVTGAKW